MITTTPAMADIPPGPPPTEYPTVPVATQAQPSTSQASASNTWSGGAIALAVVAILALVAAVVAVSILVARRT